MNSNSPYYLTQVPDRLRQEVYRLCSMNGFEDAVYLLRHHGFPQYGLADVECFFWGEPRRALTLPSTDPGAKPAEPENPTTRPALPSSPLPKRRDKLARLPRKIRDQVNAMLDNGATYDQIIDWLAQNGHPGFNKANLHNWQRGGYQDWLHQTERLATHKLQRECLLDCVADVKSDELLPLIDQLFITEFLDSVLNLDTTALKQRLSNSPRDFIALFNAYRRLKRDLTATKDQASVPKTVADPLSVVKPG